MGGIVGSLRRDAHGPDRALLVRQTELLTARGPDEGAVYLDERFALGHRRLDTEGRAHQPRWDREERVGLVVDGVLDNADEIGATLVEQGHARATDTAGVMLAAYREWGDKCFERFAGAFALALVDRRSGHLLLARDPLGAKPLYFHADARRVAFASEVRALLADPAVPKVLDPEAVAGWFGHGHPLESAPSATLVRDVRSVSAGEVMVFDSNGARSRRYWSPGVVVSADEDRLGRLRTRFEACAVAPPEPSVVALSGGRWSSAIASWRQQHRGQTRSFTQPGWDPDDRREALRLVQEHRLEHREGELQTEAQVARRALVGMDLPVADPGFVCELSAFEGIHHVWPGDDRILVGHAVPGALPALVAVQSSTGLVSDLDVLARRAPLPSLSTRLQTELLRVDRLAVAASRTVDAVFAKPTLVETVLSVGGHVETQRLVRGIIPARIEKRAARRGRPPLAAWMRGPANRWLEGLLFGRPGGTAGMLDTGRIRRWWYEHQLGVRDRSETLWRCVVFEHWCRWVLDGETSWNERRRHRRRAG